MVVGACARQLARILAKEEIEFQPDGWEEDLIVKCCRTRLAVRPKKATAVLFYNQDPDGNMDKAAIHAGCPVLRGTKWAANLWVWNGPVQYHALPSQADLGEVG